MADLVNCELVERAAKIATISNAKIKRKLPGGNLLVSIDYCIRDYKVNLAPIKRTLRGSYLFNYSDRKSTLTLLEANEVPKSSIGELYLHSPSGDSKWNLLLRNVEGKDGAVEAKIQLYQEKSYFGEVNMGSHHARFHFDSISCDCLLDALVNFFL